MRFQFLVAAWLVLASGATLVTLAANDPQEARIRREVNAVLVEATIKDRAGKVMGELKQEDFFVYENGSKQEVAHFSRDQLPLAVALVVDLSTSIRPFLRPLRYASVAALKALKEVDQVALFTFAGDVDLQVRLTHDRLAVSDQIESFSAEGSTNINTAVYEAANYLRREAPAARRVILLVSDNVPTDTGGIHHDEVVEAALEADAAVYGLKVPGRNPGAARLAAQMSRRGLVNVGKLADATGGEVFDVEQEGSLFLAFEKLVNRLKTRYTLGYYPVNAVRDGKFRTIEVKLHPTWGVKGKDYTVVAKRGYYAMRESAASR